MSNIQDNKNEILTKYIKKYYYQDFHRGTSKTGGHVCELIISPQCNLGCKYCYVKDFWHKTFPANIYDQKLTLDNLEKVLKAFTKLGLAPNFDLFTGEMFAQQIGFDILNYMYNYYKDLPIDLRPETIIVPTNYTFICSDELTKKVEDLILNFADIDIVLWLSASIEGKYMEQNRPFAKKLDIDLDVVRDDAYYDKVFEFNAKWSYGFHPMVYSEHIKDWIKNFDWFQEQFEKHGIPFDSIYLLEVRNKNWNAQTIKDYCTFLRHVFYYMYNKFWDNHEAKLEFCRWLLPGSRHGFNILLDPAVYNDRGLTCALQSRHCIRLADLAIVLCHRTMYEQMKIGNYHIDDDYNITITADHPELLMTINATNFKYFPNCINCDINEICTGQCLGAMYETTAELLTPIPTVCQLKYAKIKTIVELLQETGLWEDYLSMNLHPNNKEQLIRFSEQLRKEKEKNVINNS